MLHVALLNSLFPLMMHLPPCMYVCASMCMPVPRCTTLRNNTHTAVTQISNWPSLQHSSLSRIVLLFSSLCCFLSPPFGSAVWLAGKRQCTSSPISPAPGTELSAKSERNVKHRWPLTHKWVHGKWASPVSNSSESAADFLCIPSLFLRLIC